MKIKFLALAAFYIFSNQVAFSKYVSPFSYQFLLQAREDKSMAKDLAYGIPAHMVVGNLSNVVGGRPQYSHVLTLITPKLREHRLNKFNKKKLKRREKLFKKNLSSQELEKKLSEKKYKIIESPNWDQVQNVLALVVRADTKDVFYESKKITDLKIMVNDESKRCTAISNGINKKLSQEDKEYLNTIYDLDMHDKDWNVYLKEYPKSCFLNPNLSSVIVTFKGNGNWAQAYEEFYPNQLKLLKEDLEE